MNQGVPISLVIEENKLDWFEHELFSRRWKLYQSKWRAVVLITTPNLPPPKKIYHMHGNNPYVFGCWADLVVHLLLPKNSIPWVKARRDSVVENQTKVGQKTFPWLGAARISTIEWLQTTPSSLLDRCSAYSIYLLLLVGLPKVAINFDFV